MQYAHGLLEGHAMLGLVAAGLGGIPGKLIDRPLHRLSL